MNISFFFEEVTKPAFEEAKVESWIEYIIVKRGFSVGDINYIFCDDEYLLNINKEYLQHDYYTDIITFDYVEDKVVSGDVFISVDRVTENAASFNASEADEFLRVMAHGILHLLGLKDKSEEERENMEKAENNCIEEYKYLNS